MCALLYVYVYIHISVYPYERNFLFCCVVILVVMDVLDGWMESMIARPFVHAVEDVKGRLETLDCVPNVSVW